MKHLAKWVSEISTVVKVGVIVGTVLATVLSAWTLAPKATTQADSAVMVEVHNRQHAAQLETNRLLGQAINELHEIKGRLSR